MALRYQKRINLGKGVGLNVSKSGISTSIRTKAGSIGTRGFSLKIGIPGLSYRGSFGKSALPIMLTYFVIMAVLLIGYNLLRLILFLLAWTGQALHMAITKRKDTAGKE